MIRRICQFFGIFSFLAILAFISSQVFANHSWGGYHWARIANPFTLKLGDNVSSIWDSYLATTASDWSVSSVLDLIIVGGGGGKNCRPTGGRVEVCNRKYGNNGWLGLAQIWVSGSHIVQATTKVNDTYFNSPTYNTAAWKNLVMCQEVGHTLGLDHQDEIFNNTNLGTCMDYTSSPDSNQHPNQHDYDMLEEIYAHLDNTTTVDLSEGSDGSGGNGRGKPDFVGFDGGENASEWGRSIKDNGYVALFERDFGSGQKLFTYVIWAK